MLGKAGTMLLSIGNLPARVTRRDLREFFQAVIDTLELRSVRLGPHVTNCTILRVSDPVSGVVDYQGLVGIHPPRLGLKLIEQMQTMPMRGCLLDVRRFRHVSSQSVDPTTATMSDLLGRPAQSGAVAEGGHPTCRIEVVSATGIAVPRPVAIGAGPRSGAFAH